MIWSLSLIGMVVGAQLCVLGAVGVVAGTPPPVETALVLPDGNGTGVVSFNPASSLGERALSMDLPTGPLCGTPPIAHCANVSVAGCPDPTCHHVGGYLVIHESIGILVNRTIAVPAGLSYFYISLSNASAAVNGPAKLILIMNWLTSSGLPLAVTYVGAWFAGGFVAGVAVLALSYGTLRRSGQRLVRTPPGI